MNKNITLIGSCLLLISTQVFADRPFMEDGPRPTAEPAPVAPPAMDDDMDNRPTAAPVIEEPSAVDLDMQQPVTSPTEVQTGDVLELQPGETLPVRLLDFPRRGMSMDKVRNELGVPNVISDTVGDPPITSWTYSDRIVYFEHSKVLHVVAGQ